MEKSDERDQRSRIHSPSIKQRERGKDERKRRKWEGGKRTERDEQSIAHR